MGKLLTGRKLEVASGFTGLSDAKVQRYRASFASMGFDLPNWLPDPKGRSIEKVGTALARKCDWIAKGKGKGCSSCTSLQSKMDRNGAAWCEANIDAVAAAMVENASNLAPIVNVSKTVFGSFIGGQLLKIGAKRLIRSAIAEAKKEAEDKAKQRPKQQARRSQRVWGRLQNSPTIPDKPVPFTSEPRCHLLFHVWPFGNGWRRHLELLAPVLHRFDSLRLGIATDPTTCSAEEVKAAFGDRWETFEVVNNPSKQTGLREVATYQEMLPTLPNGVNDVTFCAHAKGAQIHTAGSENIRWWTDAMYDTVLSNVDGVIEAMRKGASIVGSFRKFDAVFHGVHKWHYSGTFYAFRNCVAFGNGVPQYRRKWWGTESWPGDHFPLSASACIVGDHAGDLYKRDEQPRLEVEQWRAKHGRD